MMRQLQKMLTALFTLFFLLASLFGFVLVAAECCFSICSSCTKTTIAAGQAAIFFMFAVAAAALIMIFFAWHSCGSSVQLKTRMNN